MLKISRKPLQGTKRRVKPTGSLLELNHAKEILGASLLLWTAASKEGEKGRYLHTEVKQDV